MTSCSRRHLLRGSAASLALTFTPGHAIAVDDSALRTHVTAARLVPYPSFRPVKSFTSTEVRDGRTLRLPEDAIGKVVLINTWATWCPPCIKEMPSLEALHSAFKDRGLLVVAVNVRDRATVPTINAWAQGRGLTFTVVKGDYEAIDFMLRDTIPQTFVLDARGRLIAWRQGELDWASDDVRRLIRFMTADTR